MAIKAEFFAIMACNKFDVSAKDWKVKEWTLMGHGHFNRKKCNANNNNNNNKKRSRNFNEMPHRISCGYWGWTIHFAAYTVEETPNAFHSAGQSANVAASRVGRRPPSNTWFRGPTRVNHNGISISWAFVAYTTADFQSVSMGRTIPKFPLLLGYRHPI